MILRTLRGRSRYNFFRKLMSEIIFAHQHPPQYQTFGRVLELHAHLYPRADHTHFLTVKIRIFLKMPLTNFWAHQIVGFEPLSKPITCFSEMDENWPGQRQLHSTHFQENCHFSINSLPIWGQNFGFLKMTSTGSFVVIRCTTYPKMSMIALKMGQLCPKTC